MATGTETLIVELDIESNKGTRIDAIMKHVFTIHVYGKLKTESDLSSVLPIN